MEKKLFKLMLFFLFVGCATFLFVGNVSAQAWTVPAKYKTMKNAQKANKDADGVGKALWLKHCVSCHGKEGYGDGKKSGELDTEIPDFTSKSFQAQTDGEIYYKSFFGKDEMPNFTRKIASEEDRWLLVNFIRKLK